jgi:hypothetical protein
MQRTQFTGAFLIVEGSTDQRFFNNLPVIDKYTCQVKAGHSKTNALAVLDILECEHFPGILAIVDADFMRVDGTAPASPNCILTDHHDLEMSLILSPALEKFLSEYGDESKIAAFQRRTSKDIRAVLLEASFYLGCLRWHSLQANLFLTFNGLNFTNFIKGHSVQANHLNMIRAVLHHSNRLDLDEAEMWQQIQVLAALGHDHAQICCGHDVVEVLTLGLRMVWKKDHTKIPPAEDIERILRLSFEGTHFVALPLYAAIITWEQANPPYTILAKGIHTP